MKKIRFIAAFVALIFLASCEKEPKVVELSISETSVTLARSGSDARAYVKITSNLSWEAESDASWIKTVPTSGEAGKTYSVIIAADSNAEPVSRTASIKVTAGSVVKTIEVNQMPGVRRLTPSDVPNYEKIYIPLEFRGDGFLSSDGRWFFGRSAQSEHFILFWEAGYGENGDRSPSLCADPRFKVNIDNLLKWAEKCYDKYINVMDFTEKGKSQLEKYKFEIFLHYQEEWAAYGSGQDNVVGCLWLNPDAARDNSTIAHEIGHSFQYQTYCDRIYNKIVPDDLSTSFRYVRPEMGTGFWEQTAQWQSMVMCPEVIFTNWYFDFYGYPSETSDASDLGCFVRNTHRHVLHEITRYSNYFIHFYWVDRYGIDFISKIWKNSIAPQDALETSMSVNGMSVADLNQDLYSYAARCATWDFSICSTEGLKHIGEITWSGTAVEDGYIKVSRDRAPEATGFNVITLEGFKAGDVVTMDLTGLPEDKDYGIVTDPSAGGWTIGFVALDRNYSRKYSPSVTAGKSTDGKAQLTWEIPEGTSKLWAVVSATPEKYFTHYWDENNSNDRLWPYKVKFDGASPVNN
ncbi:MAG: BACON domain-containing protein [Bacteroidales bacterium]|nr:BACON domain-containing protein [Bacteroidales bacterium]